MENNRCIYTEIRKGVYSITCMGRIAQQILTKNLAPCGYYQYRHTPGLWRHKWKLAIFSLVIDDFGVNYVENRHADHLITCINKY